MQWGITMTHCSRPRYSARTLNALATALRPLPRDGYPSLIVAACEPGSSETVEVVRRHFQAFDPAVARVHVNALKKGVNRNTLDVIDCAFAAGLDYVVHVEDDVLLAPDALMWFLVMREVGRRDWSTDPTEPDRIAVVTGYHRPRPDELPPREQWNAAACRHWFHPWGWATWADRWALMRQAVIDDRVTWDVQVNAWMALRKHQEIFPRLARTQNIGHYSSVHARPMPPEWYAKHHTLTHWAGKGGEVDVFSVPPGYTFTGNDAGEDDHRAQELADLRAQWDAPLLDANVP